MDAIKCINAGILFTLLSALLKNVNAISCYVCNSAELDQCHDIKSLSDEEKAKLIVDCDLQGKHYTKCRKIHQDIEDYPIRIIRQCAYSGEDTCTRRTGTYKVKMQYCQCSGHLCNSSDKKLPNKTVIAAILSIMLCFKFI